MSKIAYSHNLAKLRSYASRGDEEAAVIAAMLDKIRVLELTAGAEAANVITVTGQVTDMDGTDIAEAVNILVTSKPIAGAGTLTDGGDGSVVAGSGTVEAWVRTTATGSFEVSVTNIVAEENLLVFMLDDGQVESMVLTFA